VENKKESCGKPVIVNQNCDTSNGRPKAQIPKPRSTQKRNLGKIFSGEGFPETNLNTENLEEKYWRKTKIFPQPGKIK